MKILLLALNLLAAFPLPVMAEDKVKHVDAEGAAKLIQAGSITILDVRTADEFSEGHLKDAKNVDILAKDFATNLGELDKSKPVLVHCQAGGRSTRSLPTLEKLGFSTVYHLDGGFGDWLKAGKPVVK
ncbi:MAG: rhodanese-like domain-containing protein [Verrucomicrobia bacterium]|nr:rhodanese-like domain-containing protein [Verrucomicrobiota bacterium]